MTNPVLTDELIAELEAAANAAAPGPWGYNGSCVCPSRTEDGTTYVELWKSIADCYQPENARFIAQANPATILALLAHVADLKRQLAAASVDAERFRLFAETVVAECSGQEMTPQQNALFGCMNSATSVSMDGLIGMFDAARAVAAD